MNRHLAFGAARTPLRPSVRRCALLAAAVLTANLMLMEVLTPVLSLVAAKVLTEAGIFLAGYSVQSRLVFATPVTVPELATASTTATSGSGALPSPVRGQRAPGSRTSR